MNSRAKTAEAPNAIEVTREPFLDLKVEFCRFSVIHCLLYAQVYDLDSLKNELKTKKGLN